MDGKAGSVWALWRGEGLRIAKGPRRRAAAAAPSTAAARCPRPRTGDRARTAAAAQAGTM
eukprot:6175193-Pleurochrysis_carterae.AAC.3